MLALLDRLPAQLLQVHVFQDDRQVGTQVGARVIEQVIDQRVHAPPGVVDARGRRRVFIVNLLSKTCAFVHSIFFLPRTVLPTEFVSDRRYFPDVERLRPARHG
jgi:hypothetical protein